MGMMWSPKGQRQLYFIHVGIHLAIDYEPVEKELKKSLIKPRLARERHFASQQFDQGIVVGYQIGCLVDKYLSL